MDSNCGTGIEDVMLEAIRNRLAEGGKLDNIKCELRAKVLEDIRDGDQESINKSSTVGRNSPTFIANQIVMEYLGWIGFQYTKEVFAAESGSSVGEKPQDYLGHDGKHQGEGCGDKKTESYPLLLDLVAKLIKDQK